MVQGTGPGHGERRCRANAWRLPYVASLTLSGMTGRDETVAHDENEVDIEQVGPGGADYDRVVELGDSNRATLGHLPYAVFTDAAASGCLFVAKQNGDVIGYALIALRKRRYEVSLTHLCVREDKRGSGAARRLVDAIVRSYPSRQGIRLRCRVDYKAHSMWPKLGFEERGRKRGRSKAGTELAIWWRRVAETSLFDLLPTDTPEDEQEPDVIVAVLDTNVVIGALSESNEDESKALMADWLDGHATMAVTATVSSELGAGPQHPFPQINAADFAVSGLYEMLREASSLSTQGNADLLIVAETAASGATQLVTRDERLLQAADEIDRLVGVRVLSPADFLLSLQAETADEFQPKLIKTSGFAIQRRISVPEKDVLAQFAYQDEKAAELRNRFSRVASTPEGSIVEVTSEGTPWVLAAHRNDGAVLRVSALRLRVSKGNKTYSVLRQLLHWLRQRASEFNATSVEITDVVGEAVMRALRHEGFTNVAGVWQAKVVPFVIGCGEALTPVLESSDIELDRLSPGLISQIEMRYWPLKLFTGAVPCYVVPVRQSYGQTLLGYQEAQMTLVETAPEAATARENAYYMSRRKLDAPARILWWITGGGPESGVRAMSWLERADPDTPERLYRKYSKRGVYDIEQIREAATAAGGTPMATALLFGRTDVFEQRVSAERARELGPDIWEQGFANTTREIQERTAEALYREGMGLPQPDSHG